MSASIGRYRPPIPHLLRTYTATCGPYCKDKGVISFLFFYYYISLLYLFSLYIVLIYGRFAPSINT